MKFCVFGGFLFLGGCIGLLAIVLAQGAGYLPAYLSIAAIVLGLSLGVYGLFKNEDPRRL